jgi:hypothetical protein
MNSLGKPAFDLQLNVLDLKSRNFLLFEIIFQNLIQFRVAVVLNFIGAGAV